MHSRMWVLSMIAVATLATSAPAEIVQNWQDAANYPARVVAVYWDDRRLDANSTVRFGAWTVRFSAPAHIATYVDTPGTPARLIALGSVVANESLRCSNAVVGEQNCYLQFWLTGNHACLVGTFTGSGARNVANLETFDIACPTALDLAQ